MSQVTEKKNSLDCHIKSELSDDKYKYYENYYHFVYKLNFKSVEEGHFPIDDDIDKRREVKMFIFNILKTDKNHKQIFDELSQFITNLDLVDQDELKRYFIVDDIIVKTIKRFPFPILDL